MNIFSILTTTLSTLLIGATAQLQAAMVVYQLDPLQSSLVISGSFLGQPMTQQSPGSMVDAWSGTITGDLLGSTLYFAGGSEVRANLNPAAPFLPSASGVDNYGVQIPTLGAVAKYRDLAFDFTSGSLSHGASPSGNGVTVLSGAAEYFLPPTTLGTASMVGGTATNVATNPVSFNTTLDMESLVIPFQTTFIDPNGIVVTLTGTLVGTRSIPEPSSLGLIGIATAFFLRRRRSPVQS
jgi:hypothetical protein